MDINFGSSNHEDPSQAQPEYPEGWQTHQDGQNSTHPFGQRQSPLDGSDRQDFIQPLEIQSPVPVIYTDPGDNPVPVVNPPFGSQSRITPAAPYVLALPNMSSSSPAQMSGTDPRLSSYRVAVDPDYERAIIANPQSPSSGSRFSVGMGSSAMASPTPMSVRDSQKEVVTENFMEAMPNHLMYDPYQYQPFQPRFEPIQEKDPRADAKKRNRWMCGLSPCLFVILLLCSLALFGGGMGAGVAIGLKKKNTESVSGSNQTQVLFGSGLAATQAEGDSGSLELFYQRSDGKIWSMETTPAGAWTSTGGGASQQEVALSAKLPTPLAMVATSNEWHLFYININNVVWQTISPDKGNSWHDGPLAGRISVLKDPNVSLQACYAKNMNTTSDGIILWAATSETNIVEYSWLYGSSNPWINTGNFSANGHAGIGCYTFVDTNWYTMNVDQDNTLKVWWKDTSVAGSQWAVTNVSIPGVMANTSIGYTHDKVIFVQMEDGSLAGYNFSLSGATTSSIGSFKLPQNPIPGSQLSGQVFPQLSVYSQTTRNDITDTLQDSDGWTSSALTLPAS